MKNITIVIILLFVGHLVSAQLPESASRVLRKTLSVEINELRAQNGLQSLSPNNILRKAAKIQSIYMARRRMVTHNQDRVKVSNPYKRVKFCKGREFEIVGENVLRLDQIEFPLKERELISMARRMFSAWRSSPGHYANMINPDYEFADFGFQVQKDGDMIYATHVFGRKGTKIEGQLSSNAFGIEESNDNCSIAYLGFPNVVANMGNAIRIKGRDVMFYYHDRDYFNRIFSDLNDGIAVDLVERGQIGCENLSRLDYSPIYDGILLKPLYKTDLLNSNLAKSDYRVISKIGTIPDSLVGKEISASVILIKNGKKCQYLIPGEVPSKEYRLRPITPKLNNPINAELKYYGIIESQQIAYDFQSNAVIPLNYPEIKNFNHPVHSIEISSFSSVEGDERKNTELHKQRAEMIRSHLLNETNARDTEVNINADENWAKMYFQLKYYLADSLSVLSRDSIKAILASKNTSLPWDSLLFEQRKSIATINYEGVISDTTDFERLVRMNLRTAILTENFELANRTLCILYNSNLSLSSMMYKESIYRAVKIHPELTQNVAAIFSKIHQFDQYKAAEFLDAWIGREDELTEEAIHNLLHLHTLLSRDLINTWDLPSKRLSNVIHPNRVKNLMVDSLDNQLVLNLHLIFLDYFGQINDADNISNSFDFISDYFDSRTLNVQDEIDLALFLNRWSMYDMTNKYLLTIFEKGRLNEEAVFILMQTLNFYKKGMDFEKYEKVYLRALELNQKRWCEWVDGEFQILRDPKIKRLFCDKCLLD